MSNMVSSQTPDTKLYKRRARLARCHQFDGINKPAHLNCEIIRGQLLVRSSTGWVVGRLMVGDWSIIQENGSIKLLTADEFESKYEPAEYCEEVTTA